MLFRSGQLVELAHTDVHGAQRPGVGQGHDANRHVRGMAAVLRRFPITRADHEARLAALAAARTSIDGGGMHP